MSGSGKTCGEFVATQVWTTEPSSKTFSEVVMLPNGCRIASFLRGKEEGEMTRTVLMQMGGVHAISVKSANWFCTRAAKLVRVNV